MTDNPALTQAELARQLQVSRQSINELVSRGLLTLDASGRISLADAQLALAANLTRPDAKTLAQFDPGQPGPNSTAANAAATAGSAVDAAPPDEDSSQSTYHVARALRETFEAKLKRLRYQQETGASIELDEAKRIVFTAFRTLRDQLLNVPARIKDQVAAETNSVRVENMIEAEILAALNAFDPDQALQDTDDIDDAEL